MFYENSAPPQQQLPSDSSKRVNLYFEQLRGEILTVLDAEAGSREIIRRLEDELSVYKRAYAGLEAERRTSERLKLEADKQKDDLENQLKGHRIITLLDGDGAIFHSDLIAQGQSGGHVAAQKLSDAILQYLTANHGVNHYQVWIFVFVNKRGLLDTFGRARLSAAKIKFEEFVMGFNQAAERFMIIDVGSGKEAADAKIKVLLDDEIRLPQTQKIIFGGCHDNGYVTTLRSQITAGFKQKLILLRGYTDMAAGINDLDLPTITIPDLFLPQKLVPVGGSFSNPSTTAPLARSIPTQIVTPQVHDVTFSAIKTPVQEAFEALPFASVDTEPVPSSLKTLPSYSSAVQTITQKRAITPELDSSGSTSSSDGTDDSLPVIRPSLTNAKSRRVNPNIPLSKHKPPPCTLFFLSTCKHGAECKYGHDYILEAEHFTEIRVNAKKSPCPSKNKGEICLWGDECCYGHHCPLTTKCHFFKQGRCKFIGVDMHKEPKSQSGDKA
ncbi:hypothetical protein BDN70DRAFT_873099 [Pholiota conissans]|uniref:C3H1-type domain-containing protein n=1 Tax=Pholiota conissans TaxID=109636 RepID=A0A9P5Z9H9_9AGAR|nr:hypothetical protein BDN70DRAFT_873099 [Pholiota conissans]